MITTEELCADNRKLVDMNLKLRKENKELRDNYEQYKAVAEPEIERLEKENAEMLKRFNRLAELEEENRQLKDEVEDLTAYCNQVGKIKTGVLKLFEHIVAR